MTARAASVSPVTSLWAMPRSMNLSTVVILVAAAVLLTWRLAGTGVPSTGPAVQSPAGPSETATSLDHHEVAGTGDPADAAPSFVARGVAAVVKPAALYDTPTGGQVLRALVPGAMVAVGGRVTVRAGLVRRTMYWARLEATDEGAGAGAGGGGVYGFLPADAVALPGLPPPDLRLEGVSPAELLAPADGVQRSDAAIGNAEAVAGTTGGLEAANEPGAARRPGGSSAPGAAGVPGAAIGPAATTSPGAAVFGATAATAPAVGGVAIPWLPASVDRWRQPALDAGARHGVDPELLAIVMLVESGGNPAAVSGSGAVGLMQLMPATAADIAGRRGLTGYDPSQLHDPTTNIDLGGYYLAEQMRRFGGAADPDWQRSVELAAAAYNGGPGSVSAYLAGSRLPAEAERYRTWVGGMWRERHSPTSATFQAWWNAGGKRLVEAAAAD